MPTVDDLKNSKYISKKDVIPDILVTINGYEEVNMAQDGEQADMKWALTFDEHEKPFVLNVTNGSIIEVITGSDDLAAWSGSKIVLYFDPLITYKGKVTGGVRVRAMKTAGPTNVPETVGRPVDHVPPITEDEIPF